MNPATPQEWADAIQVELSDSYGQFSATRYSVAFTGTAIAGVEFLEGEEDDYRRAWFTSADGRWIAELDQRSGHWYGREVAA